MAEALAIAVATEVALCQLSIGEEPWVGSCSTIPIRAYW